ncbi:DUF3375 family protein [Arthrobacter parietis]|uniref:DUF3375 family protein n=1 Tax=Arthrobacter parietis TaxID=271434 RepID=UPI003D158251
MERKDGVLRRSFSSLIDADLQELRDHGFELPQTAQAYCSEWRNEGVLIRRCSRARTALLRRPPKHYAR